jgi:putative ABC transport system permease protein
MIKHIIKLMWHRKSRNFMLMLEISVSFLILFAISTAVLDNSSNLYQDRGFEYENVWVLSLDWKDQSGREVQERLQLIKQQLNSYTEIKKVSLVSNNYPFTNRNYKIQINKIETNLVNCEDEFFEIMGIQVNKGRSFRIEDNVKGKSPIVINQMLADKLFPDENPIGKLTESGQIIGVIGKYRYKNSYVPDESIFFNRISLQDTSVNYLENNLIFKVVPGTGKDFEIKMMKEINKLTRGWDSQITLLEDARRDQDKDVWLPILILIVVSVFLILNVILGLFGLLWYNINQRTAEFGLRRALGAKETFITRQVILEILVLASFAIIGGLIIAIQFPILGIFNIELHIYVLSISISALFIYGLTALCAYIPAKQASMIQPNAALHEE